MGDGGRFGGSAYRRDKADVGDQLFGVGRRPLAMKLEDRLEVAVPTEELLFIAQRIPLDQVLQSR